MSEAGPRPLVLASTSPYRRALLERLGLPFTCRAPEIDENALKRLLEPMGPHELARLLAVAKADAIAGEAPDSLVIGGDQLVAFEGRVLGKPGNVEAAKAVGSAIAEAAKAAGITKVAFDRAGFMYHGRVKALADAAREAGLEF